MRDTTRVAVAVALWLAGVSAAGAQTTISVPSNGANFACSTGPVDFLCGQSFTAPTTDAVLQSFTFTLETANPLTFELFALSGSTPTGASLLTLPFGPTAGRVPVTFTPPGGLALTGGATYAALIRANPGEGVAFAANGANPYAGGLALSCNASGPCVTNADFDLQFTAVFGRGAVVPEPSTWALVGGGLLALGGVRRRRA